MFTSLLRREPLLTAVVALRALIDGLIAVVAAPACVACGGSLASPTQGPVCAACWAGIRPLPHVAGACAAGDYDGPLGPIVHALKYGGRTSLSRQLGRLMRARGEQVLAGADCVMPVPLHWRRHWRRGFNQAALLARGLGPPVVNGLRRSRHTRTQTDLPATARQRNVRGAFVLRRGIGVKGLKIVLVDDVSTTGATLEACARTLMAAGAAEVRTLTAARVATRPTPAHRR